MAIQMSMDLYVLAVKNPNPNRVNIATNQLNIQLNNIIRGNMSHDERIKGIGLVSRNNETYVIYIGNRDITDPNYLDISDFVFETTMELNTQYDPALYIERDLKLVKSKETPSGFNLSEYFNGEITNDMSHHDFFSSIVNILSEKNDQITGSFLKAFVDMSNSYLNKLLPELN